MNIVVIGAGHPGANVVEDLRTQGYSGDLPLLGAEPHLSFDAAASLAIAAAHHARDDAR